MSFYEAVSMHTRSQTLASASFVFSYVVDETTPTPENEDYLVIALAVGIPASVIILVLIVVISLIFILMLRKSRVEEEIEAMYIQRRFQGLSLEEQRRIQQQKKGKKVERRRSSAAESRGSQLTPHSRGGKIRSANPFGLQEWQLKLSGIDIDIDTEVTDIDGEDEYNRKPMGAINPLLLAGLDNDRADYDAVRQPPKNRRSQPSNRTKLHGKLPPPTVEESNSDSSDSFNPYDY